VTVGRRVSTRDRDGVRSMPRGISTPDGRLTAPRLLDGVTDERPGRALVDGRAGVDQASRPIARGDATPGRRVDSTRSRDGDMPPLATPGRSRGATSIDREVRDAYPGPRSGRAVRETATRTGDTRCTVKADLDTWSGPRTASRALTRTNPR
jgi:hypothetical protein